MRAKIEVEGNEEELELVLRAQDLRYALREIYSMIVNFKNSLPFPAPQEVEDVRSMYLKILEQIELKHLVIPE